MRTSRRSAPFPSTINIRIPSGAPVQISRVHRCRRDRGAAAIRRSSYRERGRGLRERGQGDWRESRGKNSHDHLLATEQRVANELARAQRDGGVGVGHLGGLMAVDVGDNFHELDIRRFEVGFSLWW